MRIKGAKIFNLKSVVVLIAITFAVKVVRAQIEYTVDCEIHNSGMFHLISDKGTGGAMAVGISKSNKTLTGLAGVGVKTHNLNVEIHTVSGGSYEQTYHASYVTLPLMVGKSLFNERLMIGVYIIPELMVDQSLEAPLFRRYSDLRKLNLETVFSIDVRLYKGDRAAYGIGVFYGEQQLAFTNEDLNDRARFMRYGVKLFARFNS